MPFKVNPSVSATAPPPIPLAARWASLYDPASFAGRKLINLSQGVPGSPPDPRFIKKLGEVIQDPMASKYGAILGETALREALVAEYADIYGPKGTETGWGVSEDAPGVRAQEIGIVCGANMAFMAAVMTLCQAGDEIILPLPWYFNQAMTLSLLSLTVVPLPTEPPSFFPSVETARKAITPKTKAIVLVTPNNPTGAIYTPDLLDEFAALAKEHSLALIIDETYRDFVPPTANGTERGCPHRLFNNPSWRETVISLFSFSKSYSIPGHRLGAITASTSFLEAVSTVLDCMQINPPRPSQLAIAPLLATLRPSLLKTSTSFIALLSLFKDVLASCPGWQLLSHGAFYAFVAHPFEEFSSERVCEVLARKYGVVTLPGEFFLPPRKKNQEGGEKCRWLRVAVANVGEEDVRLVGERLRALTVEDLKSF